MGNLINSVFLPIFLTIIMFGIGLSLTNKDFEEILHYRKSITIGIICQIVLLPIISFVLTIIFQLNKNDTLGLLALSLVPGAITSNIFTYLLRGNVALSICLTVVISLIAPITLSFALESTTRHLWDKSNHLSLSFTHTVLSLLSVTIMPLVVGMFTRRSFENFF